ncbi:hypothetical protein R6Q57_012555 [Mikania cordata]
MFNSQHWATTPEQVAADALNAGLNLNCGNWLKINTMGAVQRGLVEESVVDRAVSNNFATLMRLGFFDGDPSKQMYGDLGPKDVCTLAHQELAREAARQGIVLLKNALHSLPLSPTAINSLAVIGPNANATTTMIGNYAGIPCKYTTPLQGLSASVKAVYHAGCGDTKCVRAQLNKAREVAAEADAVVLVMGTDQSIEAESLDRTRISLPGQQNRLISEVASVSKGPVILVIMSGTGMDIQFSKENPKITSILWVGFPGEAGGAALADIIFGQYNPGGRLPMTWYPQFFAEMVNMTNMNMRPNLTTRHPGYTYRFYRGTTVYPFGYGLSYSRFVQWLVRAPKLVQLSTDDLDQVCHYPECETVEVGDGVCRNLGFEVVIGVKNVGEMDGSYSVLLFSYPPPWVHNIPQLQLLDFEKVFLGPQEVRLVRFQVDGCKHLSVVDEDGNRKVALGEHVLQRRFSKIASPFSIDTSVGFFHYTKGDLISKLASVLQSCSNPNPGHQVVQQGQQLHAQILVNGINHMLGYGTCPDKYTFPYVIKACGRLGAIGLAKSVHHTIQMMGFEMDVYVGSSLIKAYAVRQIAPKR